MHTLADQTVNRWFGSAFIQAGSPISQVFIDNARAICEFDIAATLEKIEIASTTLVEDQDRGGALQPTIDFHKTYFEL
jgi:hypothetical protein